MPDVTISDVMTLAKQKLGDEAGELFTDTILLPHVKSAYRDLGRLLAGVYHPKARRIRFVRVLANQSSFTPDYGSIASGFKDPIQIDERQESSALMISTIAGSGTDVITITTTIPHGLTAGQIVMLVGTGHRFLDGAYSVASIPGSSQFTVRGTLAVGALNQGMVSIGVDRFLPVSIVSYLPQFDSSPIARINQMQLSENTFSFLPCTSNRQVRLFYEAGADDITAGTDLIGMDDALDFLAVVGGSYAAAAKGAAGKAEMLETMAFGPTRNRFRPEGGLAYALLASAVRTYLQSQQWARPHWRPKRVQPNGPFPIT